MAGNKSLNHVMVMGNAGRDPEIKTLENGNQIGNISIASNEGYFDKDHKWVDKAEWHRITVWGKACEKLAKMQKGDTIMVTGKLQTDSWEDPQGGAKRFSTSIVAWQLQLIDDHGRKFRERENGGALPDQGQPSNENKGGRPLAPEDDLPF